MNLFFAAKQRNRIKLASVVTVGLLLLALATLAGCSSDRETASAAPETVSNVSVLSVQTANVPDLVEVVGTLRAAQTSQLAGQMMANIVEIRVHEGDRVQRGQVLAVLDEAQPRAALDRATAADLASQQGVTAADSDLALAEATFKRYQTCMTRSRSARRSSMR
jgi:multidrug efflux pump subunit AcrA (membrane-fusion protein)